MKGGNRALTIADAMVFLHVGADLPDENGSTQVFEVMFSLTLESM